VVESCTIEGDAAQAGEFAKHFPNLTVYSNVVSGVIELAHDDVPQALHLLHLAHDVPVGQLDP
jgi:hypothetical protein